MKYKTRVYAIPETDQVHEISDDFKRMYLINNNKDNEYYLKEFNNYSEAKDFVINHLDLSKNWRVL